MEPYEFTDTSGEVLEIVPADAIPATAYVTASPAGAYIPAHRVAEVAAALYEAAGQDVPQIHDEAELQRLATMLHYASEGVVPPRPPAAALEIARILMAHGVRCPEPKP